MTRGRVGHASPRETATLDRGLGHPLERTGRAPVTAFAGMERGHADRRLEVVATSCAGLANPGYPASPRSIGSPASDSTYAQSRTPGTGS